MQLCCAAAAPPLPPPSTFSHFLDRQGFSSPIIFILEGGLYCGRALFYCCCCCFCLLLLLPLCRQCQFHVAMSFPKLLARRRDWLAAAEWLRVPRCQMCLGMRGGGPGCCSWCWWWWMVPRRDREEETAAEHGRPGRERRRGGRSLEAREPGSGCRDWPLWAAGYFWCTHQKDGLRM